MTYIPAITKAQSGLWEMRSLQNVSKDQAQRAKVPFVPYALPETLPEYLRPTQVMSQISAIKNSNMHRAFWRIKDILVNTPCSSGHPMESNLREACAREQIPVSQLYFPLACEWLRDCMVLRTDGQIILPSDLNIDDSFDEIMRNMTGDRYCAMQGGVATSQMTRQLLNSSGLNMRVAPFYFEGGNLIQTFDPETGSICYLSGASNLLYSFLNGEVTFAGVEKDLLQFMRKTERVITPSETEVQKMQNRLCSAGLLKSFSEDEKLWLAKFAHFAIVYVKKMMEETLEAPVIVIGHPLDSPPEFHIDMFLVSTPQFIGLQSPKACMQLIENILQNRDLTDCERGRLKIYHENAEFQNADCGEKLREIYEDLTQARFRVVPLPGMFRTDDHFAVNFLNSVAGIGKDDLPFYITNGSGHSADRYLREAFVTQIKEQGVERVYFVGRDEQQDLNLPAMQYDSARQNLEELGGGIHCRVQVIHGLTSSGPCFGLGSSIDEPRQRRPTHSTPADGSVSAGIYRRAEYAAAAISLPRFFRKMLQLRLS